MATDAVGGKTRRYERGRSHRMLDDDLEQLNAGLLLYDALYRWYRDATTAQLADQQGKAVTELAATQKVGAQEPAHGISFNEALLVWIRGWPSRASAAQPARSL